MSVYARLGLNFTGFNGADILTQNTINYLNQTSINLPQQWQINDLSNSDVGFYYQNPHTTVLANVVIVLNEFINTCNVNLTTFSVAANTPNV